MSRALDTQDQPSAGSRLDPYVARYAARTAGMTASEIRALFSVASRPEVVSLAGGMPFLDALPARRDRRRPSPGWSASAAPRRCSTAPARATSALREQIAEVMALVGVRATPTTSSSPSARSRRSTSSPGSSATPATSCSPRRRRTSGRSASSRRTSARSCTSPWTTTGWCPRRCARRSRGWRAEGRAPKFLYTIPSFHNPAGVTQGPQRRPRDPRRSPSRHGLLVLEDDPYGLLGLRRQPSRGRCAPTTPRA